MLKCKTKLGLEDLDFIHTAYGLLTNRRKAGSKHHLIVDAAGTPLNIRTGASRHDSTQIMPLLDDVSFLGGRRGQPLCKPNWVQTDRAYDCASVIAPGVPR
ncbi:transposase [Noviherbaspirillum aerium]|uniref:transposase n=1 Tax=Noviherbaspirillum aerium TaxID=2588497 RepID=UPI0038510B25